MPFKTVLIAIALLVNLQADQQEFSEISASITIIGNDIGLKALNIKELKSYLKGEIMRWPNQKAVEVVLPSSKHAGSEIMARELFGTSMRDVKRYWLSLVFQGRAEAPTFLSSNQEIISYVRKNEGTIGVLINFEANDLIIEVTDN